MPEIFESDLERARRTRRAMKHQAIITTERACCTCHRMPAVMRPDNETGGNFTLRAHKAWELHVEMAEVDAPLFDYAAPQREKPISPQGDLFGASL